jgi:hypothetical protein
MGRYGDVRHKPRLNERPRRNMWTTDPHGDQKRRSRREKSSSLVYCKDEQSEVKRRVFMFSISPSLAFYLSHAFRLSKVSLHSWDPPSNPEK